MASANFEGLGLQNLKLNDDDSWKWLNSRPNNLGISKKGTEYVKRIRQLQIEEFEKCKQMNYNDSMSEVDTSFRMGLSTVEQASIFPPSTINVPPSFVAGPRQVLQQMAVRFPEENPQFKDLQIIKFKSQIMDEIYGNAITIISGPTGCGKTTMIPQFILEFYKQKKMEVKMVITQPRRLAARTNAKTVADSLGVRLGSLVGYKVGMDKEFCSPDTLITYCTAGVLKKMLIGKKSLTDWTHVILDEVHDREEDMDFIMLLCKQFIFTNSRGVKLILMSATLDVPKLEKYFSWQFSLDSFLHRPSTFKIECQTNCEIKVTYMDDLVDTRFQPYLESMEFTEPSVTYEKIELCSEMVEALCESHNPGAILIFLPGEEEIRRMKNSLEKHSLLKLDVFVLHSRIPDYHSELMFQPPRIGHQKVILSTNIAESSITIPDVKIVIDFCLTKILTCDPETNYVKLKMDWADDNSCTQRKGRCGRTSEGRVYRLVTSNFYMDVIAWMSHPPEILRAPLDKVILDAKQLELGPPKTILALAMDPPNIENVSISVMQLKEMGALLKTVKGEDAEDDGDLTVLGEIISRLPIDARLCKLITYGFLFGVLEEAVIIAAGLTGKSIFAFPYDQKLEGFSNKLVWAQRTFSDCLAILNAYTVWNEKKKNRFFLRKTDGTHSFEFQWCKTRFLQQKALMEMERTIEELHIGLKNLQMVPINNPNHEMNNLEPSTKKLLLQIAIFGAFYPNYLSRDPGSFDPNDVYKFLHLHPYESSVALRGLPTDENKMAMVYEDQIKAIFSKVCACSPGAIKVFYETHKIIVTFDWPLLGEIDLNSDFSKIGSHNLAGDVLHHVYVALKIPRLNRELCDRMLTLHRYTREDEQAIFESLERKMDNPPSVKSKPLADFFEALERKRDNPPTPSVTGEHPADAETVGQVDPPGGCPITEMKIAHIRNPNSIWLNYLEDDSKIEDLERGFDCIVQMKLATFAKNKSDLMLNRIYIVHTRDGRTYRGQLKDYNDNLATVFAIDIGTIEEVYIDDLIIIDNEIIKKVPVLVETKGLALECTLSRVKPNRIRSISTTGDWDEQSVDTFKNLFPNKGKNDVVVTKLVASLPHTQGWILSVEMYLDDVSINNTFLNVKDERSRLFAEEELEFDLPFDGSRISYGRNLLKSEHKTVLKNTCISRQVTLRGPTHPLVAEASLVTHAARGKKSKMEFESVNSIVLNQNPASKTSQWYVASHVSSNQFGQSLIARATTAMPLTPGLGPILIMTFAPQVELRCDKARKHYSGCIAGLGSKPIDWSLCPIKANPNLPKRRPYYTENDIELPFEVKFDNFDIENINMIRFYISSCLSRPLGPTLPDGKPPSLPKIRETPARYTDRNFLIKAQRIFKSKFEELLYKSRKLQDPLIPPEGSKWDTFPPDVEIVKFEILNCDDHFLPTFPAMSLKHCIMVEVKPLVEELQLLEDMVFGRKPFVPGHGCPICEKSVKFLQLDQIRPHCATETHQKNKRELGKRINK